MRRLTVVGAAVALLLGLGNPVIASDFSHGQGATAAPNWKVYNYNASGQAYSSTAAMSFDSGIGFAFLSTPDTALFTTKQDKTLLGDLTGGTITATFEIRGTTDATFTYYDAPGACGLHGPSARLYFEGNTNGPFTYDTAGYSKYWWSNPESATLASLVGNTVTLTVPLTPGNWSDWGGQPGSSVPTSFAAAVAKVSAIGLSFGGGCFFANGVGMSTGSASFVLSSYAVSP